MQLQALTPSQRHPQFPFLPKAPDYDPMAPRPGHDEFYPEMQAAVAASSSSSAAAAPLNPNSLPFRGPEWQGPAPATSWSCWEQQQVVLPQMITSTQDACSWMQPHTTMLGPAGYAAQPSPHAPAADNEPERAALIASLRVLLEGSERRAERANDELLAARAELLEARAEAQDAKIAEIKWEHAEMRLSDKYNNWWREVEDAKWRSWNGWRS